MNKDLKTDKEEKNLVLVIENASTELKKILNDALMYGFNKSLTRSKADDLIMKTINELKEMKAPDDIIHSTEIALKQTFLRQYTMILTKLEKSKNSDKTGIISLTLKKLKSNKPYQIETGKGIIVDTVDGVNIFNASINNLREYMTEVEEAAGARYVDYANMVQEKIIEIGDAIADGTLTEVDKLGRHKSIRNMAEINVRYNLIVDDVKKMSKDTKFVMGSSHPNASERCSYWQGKIFLLDIDVASREMGQFDKKKPPTPKVIGHLPNGEPYYSLKQACENGFLSYNCQHRLVKYYEGMQAPQYNLMDVEAKRNLTTRQRVLENRIRQYKARQVIANPNVKKVYLDPFSGNYRKMSQKRNAELLSQYWTQRYNKLCEDNDLPRYTWRLRITETERMVRNNFNNEPPSFEFDKAIDDAPTITKLDIPQLTQEFSKNITGNTGIVKEFVEQANIADDNVYKIISNYSNVGEVVIKNGKPRYSPTMEDTIYLQSTKDVAAAYHEFGHSIDHLVAKDQKFETEGHKFHWLSDEIEETRIEARNNLDNSIPNDLVDILEEQKNKITEQVKPQLEIIKANSVSKIVEKYRGKNVPRSLIEYDIKLQVQNEISKAVSNLTKNDETYKRWSCLSDIYDAITDGMAKNSKVLTGRHGSSYYLTSGILSFTTTGNVKKQNTEIFANFCEMKMADYQEQLIFLKNNQPKLYDKLEERFAFAAEYLARKK